jgi:hypothetical protein
VPDTVRFVGEGNVENSFRAGFPGCPRLAVVLCPKEEDARPCRIADPLADEADMEKDFTIGVLVFELPRLSSIFGSGDHLVGPANPEGAGGACDINRTEREGNRLPSPTGSAKPRRLNLMAGATGGQETYEEKKSDEPESTREGHGLLLLSGNIMPVRTRKRAGNRRGQV